MDIKPTLNIPRRNRFTAFLRRKWLMLLLLAVLGGLFAYALAGFDVAEVLTVLRRLSAGQILLLAGLNVLIVLVLSWRWWWLLKMLGYRTAFGRLTLDRQSSFAVSYLTPGAHFGGEPLQVLTLQRFHGVAPAPAMLSVGLDRVFELLLNAMIVAALPGLMLYFYAGEAWSGRFWPLLCLLPLPVLLAGAVFCLRVFRRCADLGEILEKYGRKVLRPAYIESVRCSLSRMAAEIDGLHHARFPVLAAGMGISLLGWLLMIGEYWLLLYFLNSEITAAQVLLSYSFARGANWVPVPAAAGALETGQVLALGTAGVELPVAVGLTLLIRVRDLAFAAVGLGWGGLRYYGIGVIDRRRAVRVPKQS